MSNAASIHHEDVHTAHSTHDAHHEHHHHETFITKYVFSQDHKMIAKQFLITGMIWAIIGGLFSVLFRLQLGYPGALGQRWKTAARILLCTCYHAWYHPGFLCAHSRA
jgi:cytochrome c oxidase subunit I